MDIEDTEACYRAVKSRDRRFDGVFYTGVTSTGIYCRPSCPAITPQRRNVTFHRTAAAAQAAGFRACKRCLPDATPGSPDWDVAADVAGRAMRLIADGVVEREGVERARGPDRLHLAAPRPAARHRARCRPAGPGPGPAGPDRAGPDRDHGDAVLRRRVRGRLRQRPAVQRHRARGVRRLADRAPRARRRLGRRRPPPGRRCELRLAVRRAVRRGRDARLPGRARRRRAASRSEPGCYARTLRLPHGPGRVRLELDDGVPRGATCAAGCEVGDLRDVAAAVERCRRLLDADCDPVAVEDALADDRLLARLVRRRPGLRVPGHVDGAEIAVRTVIGQQVSVAAAATVTARTRRGVRRGTPRRGEPGRPALPDLRGARRGRTRRRCRCPGLARAGPGGAVPRARRGRHPAGPQRRPRRGAATAAGAARRSGRGPPTTSRMRALGHPDVFLPTDLGVRNAVRGLGVAASGTSPHGPTRGAPWRSYALMHLWSSLAVLDPDRAYPRRRRSREHHVDQRRLTGRTAADRRAPRRPDRDRVRAAPACRRPRRARR